MGGRPPGPQHNAGRMFHQRVAALHRTGEAPGDILIEDMLFWYKGTKQIKSAIETMLKHPQLTSGMRDRLVALLETYNNHRERQVRAAALAAPYCHPKLLSQVAPNGDPVEPTDFAGLSDERLAEIVTRGITAAMEKRDQGMITVTSNSR